MADEPAPASAPGGWRSRNVVALGLVSFFTDIHSETILALLPQFMANVLGLKTGTIGIIEGLAEATASGLKILSGWWSDRVRKRKPVVLAGYTLSTLTKPLLALAGAGWHVLAVRLADRVGKGIRSSARDALVADSVVPAERGRAFGFHRAMDTAGAIVGTALAIVLFRALQGDYRRIFLVSTLAGVAAVVALIVGVREQPPGPKVAKQPPAELPGSLPLFLAAHFVYSAGNFTYAFFLLRAQQVGVAPGLVPVLYLWHNLVYAAAAFPFGLLLDRLGARRAQSLTYLIHAVSCLGFMVAARPGWMPLWFAIYGLELGAVGACSRATAAGLIRSGRRATGMGVFHATEGLGLLVAGLVGGQLADRVGASAPFAYGAVAALGAAALAWFALRRPSAAAEESGG